MSRSAVELDFFQMEKNNTSLKPQPNELSGRRRSFRDIQSVISKMNPELLKSVIGSVELVNPKLGKSSENGDALASKTSVSDLPIRKHDEGLFHAFGGSTCGLENTPETTPLTIFYNGAVAVFDLPQRMAENIFKLAASSNDRSRLLDTRNRDLPIARRKSLQRFLEKRKERLNLASSRYGCPVDHTIFFRPETNRILQTLNMSEG